ncbi:IclR family transcriptional regulator [Lacicoccus alkaliphilus]|uniref:Transcriptional regulator, IclR family n=1 Tax=Lacicoccus alkaliphilus DSM 16010 TaxID=1123231 RepID=A0A1M7CZH6_9BACL|nr:IclR family transcriptional regulator [Salinicoccus alkaliphilus]SHL72610.1 transcriptional regulator, IclR family [Salinicoccus alkaliphilus DSM 16010]
MNNQSPNGSFKSVAVLEKAIKIITFLEKSNTEIGLTDISKGTGINKATCYRILETFLLDNIVEFNEISRKYYLGHRLLQLGTRVKERINIGEKALPYLKDLTDKTRASSYLCVLNNNKSLCVERVEGHDVQILLMKVGDQWPLYIGAAPRAILAYLDDESIEHSLSSNDNLDFYNKRENDFYLNMIKEIREKGFSQSEEDVVDGVTSIGAPIFDHTGRIFGAVSISTATSLLSKNRTMLENAQLLINTANGISQSIGWRGEILI